MQSSVYNPFFTPMRYSPALWLDASDASTLVMDGARTFASASSQYLSCASNATLVTGDVDFYWSGWFYPLALADQSIWGKFSSTTNNDTRTYILSTGKCKVDSYNTGGTNTSSATTTNYTANAWNYLFWYHSKTDKKIYVSLNGADFVASSAYTGTLTSGTVALTVGTERTAYFNGRLDSVTFGKPATDWLTSNATALRDYLYNGGSGRRSSDFMASAYYTGGNPSGAVSWWDMDARSGNETDRIGSNNLTDNGGVGYAAGVASGLVQYTGDPVKQWSDKSGNARHVTAASDAARPTYTTAAQNGLSGLLYDGLNDALSSSALASDIVDYTFFAVVNHTTLVPSMRIVSIGDVSGIAGYHNGLAYVAVSPGSRTGGTATANSPKIIAFGGTHSAAVLPPDFLNINGTDIPGTTGGGAYATTAGQSICIGNRVAADRTWAGYYFEALLFLRKCTATEVSTIIRYLGNKWGISVA